jgi:hypothetical protein
VLFRSEAEEEQMQPMMPPEQMMPPQGMPQ